MRLLTIPLFLLLACSNGKEPAPATPPTPPPAPAADAAPAPVDPAAGTQPAGTDCVAECVQRNQMKATSPEVIEADCKAECAAR